MLAIDFKGGGALASNGVSGAVALALFLALALSFCLPLIAYVVLRAATPLDVTNASAVATHYGSVSVVTFVAATGFLGYRAVTYEGYVVAMLALMETPAIVTGLLLARVKTTRPAESLTSPFSKDLAREVFLSSSVILLVGSFVIG